MLNQNDVTTIPLAELMADLQESLTDLRWCQIAMQNEAFEYGPLNASTAARFVANVKQQYIITAELSRRITEALQAIQTPAGKTQEQHVLDILALVPDCQALRYLQGLDLPLSNIQSSNELLLYSLNLQAIQY